MRSLLCTVLLAASASAQAEWLKVAEAAGTTYALDTASVVEEAGMRRATVRQDYAVVQADGARSRDVRYDVDCGGERLRSVAATGYAEPAGQGRRVSAWEATSEWLYVAQRTGSSIARATPYRAVVRAVCAR